MKTKTFRTDTVTAWTKYVDLLNYTQEVELFEEKMKNSMSPYASFPFPIGIKDVKTSFGKCFFLFTDSLANLEKQFQGKYFLQLKSFTCHLCHI